jgi:D-alanine transaminase
VTAVLDRLLVDFASHLSRLDRSLAEIALAAPLSHDDLRELHRTLIERNNLDEGIVYLQISRGAAERDFAYPDDATPTVVAFTQSRPLIANPYTATGVKVITIPDLRWKRRDIKSTSMLAQAMGKQAAKLKGAYEGWMVEDGCVTEGTSSSAFILDDAGVIRTQPLGHHILPGVTRRAVLKLAETQGVSLDERPFTVAEALRAREAFMTAASAFVLPVVEIDGVAIGDGHPGPVARAFRDLYIEAARNSGV